MKNKNSTLKPSSIMALEGDFETPSIKSEDDEELTFTSPSVINTMSSEEGTKVLLCPVQQRLCEKGRFR